MRALETNLTYIYILRSAITNTSIIGKNDSTKDNQGLMKRSADTFKDMAMTNIIYFFIVENIIT